MALQYIILLLLFGSTLIQSESILSNGCPADLHIHRLLPHETECSQFYQCSNGQRVLMHCAPGTLFSVELQVCVMPHQANCNQIAEPELTVSEEESEQTNQTEQDTSPDHLPNGCPKDFSIHVLLPHESDCDKFYQCSNGIKYLMQCGAGTLFDSKLQVCNWPHAVQCQPTTTNPTVEPVTEESTTPKSTTEDNDKESTVELTTVEEITNKYTTVDDGEQTTIDPITTTFEEFTTQDFTTVTLSPNSTTEENTTVTQSSIYTTLDYASETENSKYTTDEYATVTQNSTITESSNSTIEDTDSTNGNMTNEYPNNSTTQEFNTVTEIPKYTTDEPIITTEAPICPTGVFGNVPHPDRCDAFYLCSGGIAFEVVCASGFEFDPVVKVCVEIAEGGCTLGSVNDNESENSNFTTTEFPINIDNNTVTQEVSNTSVQDFTTKADNDAVTDEIKDETTTTELPTDYPGTQESSTQKYSTDDVEDKVTQDSIDATNTDGTTPRHNNDSTEVNSGEEITNEPHMTTEDPTTINEIISDNKSTQDDGFLTNSTETESADNSSTENFTASTQNPNYNTTEESNTTTLKPICSVGIFGNVPHPERCDVYFLCSGGVAFEIFCSTGFEFNPDSQECVEISEGGCTLGKDTTLDPDNFVSVEADNTTISDTTTEVTANNTTEGAWDLNNTTTQRLNETTTPTDTEFQTTQEYELTTQSSENNITQEITTEESVNNITETTDYSTWDNANVTVTLAPTQSPDISTEEPTDDSIETEDITDVLEPICPPGVFGNVAHPVRCDAFYICSGGLSFEVFCSSGFEFDPASQECVKIYQGGCTLKPISTEENTELTSTTTESYNEVEATDAETGITDAPLHVPPPIFPPPIPPVPGNPGEDQGVPEVVTDVDEDSISDDAKPICPAGVFGNVPHQSRCDAYYLCSAGMAFEVLCPSGFEFDSNTKNCVEIAEGGCTLSNNRNNLALKIFPIHTKNDQNSKIEEGRNENICKRNEITSHETLCNSFYRCIEGEKIQLFCSEGYEFQPRLKKCVPITKAGCSAYKKTSLQ